MDLVIKSESEERTLALGQAIGAALSPGDVVCLDGELGTGKTVLVRGIVRGRGYDGTVRSPTFTIMHTYPELKLCHVDAYRLADGDELIDTGIDDFLDGSWVCAVEWAERVRPALPERALSVKLVFGKGENDRMITVRETGGWDGRLAGLIRELLRNGG
jgi:tRNA threonylcarbamoyladenosine biosynthesis protein TsaE